MGYLVMNSGSGSAWDVSTMLSSASSVITTVSGWITDNPVLTACVGLGVIVPTGIFAFKKLIKATRRG